MTETPDPIPAATLVIFRKGRRGPEPELLMVVRSQSMSFAGGMAVFPGGRVDPSDRDLAQSLDPSADTDEVAHRIAAVRETLEETGLAIGMRGTLDEGLAAKARAIALDKGDLSSVMAECGLTLDPEALVPFARWLPLGLAHSRIFDTRFYLADLGTGAVEVEVDATENTHLFWVSAREALAKAERGEISIIFPTRRNLERLAQFGSFAEAKAHADATPVVTVTPWVEGGKLRIPEDAGYPVTSEPADRAQRA